MFEKDQRSAFGMLGVTVLRILFCSVLLLISSSVRAERFEYFPGAVYDPAVPDLHEVLGYDVGDRISTHHEVERYLRALAEASPSVQLVKIGESWEGRSLGYLIVSSKGNVARVDEIKSGMQRLAVPRDLEPAEADQLIDILPAVAWLSFGIHGN